MVLIMLNKIAVLVWFVCFVGQGVFICGDPIVSRHYAQNNPEIVVEVVLQKQPNTTLASNNDTDFDYDRNVIGLEENFERFETQNGNTIQEIEDEEIVIDHTALENDVDDYGELDDGTAEEIVEAEFDYATYLGQLDSDALASQCCKYGKKQGYQLTGAPITRCWKISNNFYYNMLNEAVSISCRRRYRRCCIRAYMRGNRNAKPPDMVA